MAGGRSATAPTRPTRRESPTAKARRLQAELNEMRNFVVKEIMEYDGDDAPCKEGRERFIRENLGWTEDFPQFTARDGYVLLRVAWEDDGEDTDLDDLVDQIEAVVNGRRSYMTTNVSEFSYLGGFNVTRETRDQDVIQAFLAGEKKT